VPGAHPLRATEPATASAAATRVTNGDLRRRIGMVRSIILAAASKRMHADARVTLARCLLSV